MFLTVSICRLIYAIGKKIFPYVCLKLLRESGHRNILLFVVYLWWPSVCDMEYQWLAIIDNDTSRPWGQLRRTAGQGYGPNNSQGQNPGSLFVSTFPAALIVWKELYLPRLLVQNLRALLMLSLRCLRYCVNQKTKKQERKKENLRALFLFLDQGYYG